MYNKIITEKNLTLKIQLKIYIKHWKENNTDHFAETVSFLLKNYINVVPETKYYI